MRIVSMGGVAERLGHVVGDSDESLGLNAPAQQRRERGSRGVWPPGDGAQDQQRPDDQHRQRQPLTDGRAAGKLAIVWVEFAELFGERAARA